MSVWELRCGAVNDHAMLVPADRRDIARGAFKLTGQPKDWPFRPVAQFAVPARKNQKPKPPANVSEFIPGALVLDEKARAALGGFLSRFGELLELDVDGGFRYLFNCTRLVECVDMARSQVHESGVLVLEAFDEAAVPEGAAVFKDPRTAKVRLYVNDAGRAAIEEAVSAAGIVGVEVGAPRPL